jgi:hypothetical protein
MKTKLLLAVLLVCATLPGQNQNLPEVPPTYIVSQSIVGGVAVVTITMPASTAAYANLVGAAVSCSAGCNLTQELDSNAPTTTLATPGKLHNQSDVPFASVYTASNIASAGVIAHPYPIQAGVLTGIDLSQTHLSKNSSARQSFTLRTDNTTGTNGITLIWNETTQP